MNKLTGIGMVCAVLVFCLHGALARDVLQQAVAEAQTQQPAAAAPQPTPQPKPKPHVEIDQIEVVGVIEGENLTLSLAFDADAERDQQEIPLVTGEMVLDTLTKPTLGHKLRYDKDSRTYFIGWPNKGQYRVEATFAARAKAIQKSEWREAVFALPASQVRQLKVRCDRTDLQVQFPGAMRIDREEEQGQLVITAILGPGKPFTVRWKPQVQQLDAKLVATGKVNTVATVSAAALRIDSVYQIDIAQGELEKITFELPTSLGVTRVIGNDIRDWSCTDKEKVRTLTVTLVRPQKQQYALQVIAEQPLPPFPCELAMPVISPSGGIRAGGTMTVGTGSAIQLQVAQTSGLSQVDAKMFPRVLMSREQPRPLPTAKAFYYTFAASPYQLSLKLDDIVPSYDASHRLDVNVKEDDLTIDAEITLDVRDAPIRSVQLHTPAGYLVSSVTGSLVDDYRVKTAQNGKPATVEVQFGKPVMGKTNLQMRLELGRSPLENEPQKLTGVSVVGAKVQRGYMVVAAEQGIRFVSQTAEDLREVNTASVETQLPNARLAYRFRQADWTLDLAAELKEAGIRTESFHLICLGEGRMYGSVAVSYFITGSPVDELRFRLPATLKNVQFVGRDVRRSTQQDDLWTVKLQRKVIGDYNLGITYNLPYKDGEQVTIGAVECADVQTTIGYIAITSHQNLNLTAVAHPRGEDELMEITREELPGGYRLLATAPLLKSYKYIKSPHRLPLRVDSYDRGDVIPALIEVMQATTNLALQEDNKTESVTTMRYKVKNTSSQFLTLQLPEGAKVWSTRLIERDARGREKATRLSTSFDKQRGLMIPLRRTSDPNEPITIELTYGQVHDELSWWESQLLLKAPHSEIPATFAEWDVRVSQDYAIQPDATGNMVAQVNVSRPGDLSWVLEHVLSGWAWSFGRLIEGPSDLATMLTLGLLAAVVVLGILFSILYRPALPVLFVLALLLMLLGIGVGATQSPSFQNRLPAVDHMTHVRFTQAVNVDAQAVLGVGVKTIPAWRRHVRLGTVVAGPILLILTLAAAIRWRRLRKPMLAAALAVVLYGSAQFAVMTVPLGHVLTWGLPALLVLGFLWMRLLRPLLMHPPVPAAAAAALLLGAATLLSGCGGGKEPIVPISDKPLIERIECQLTANDDSMELDYSLKISATKPMKFALIDQSAVLLSDDEPRQNIKIELDEGKYFISVKEKGVYEVKAKFLAPLPEADADRVRGFSLPMPMALSNRVNLTVPEPDLNITSPTAIRFEQEQQEKATTARALLGPGEPIHFVWRPRARQTKLEETRFYGDVTSVARFDAGLVETHHLLDLQIAQGELKQLRVTIPAETTVTSVQGQAIGAWRFDPANNELEVRLSHPVTNAYKLYLVTQAAEDGAPYQFTLRPLVIDGALRHDNIVGLIPTDAVYITAKSQSQPINVDDFARDAAALLQQVMKTAAPPKHAYRLAKADEMIAVDVAAVQPEVRVEEAAEFKLEDERLKYNGRLNVSIAKAGLFAMNLTIPAAYDIDTLTAAPISHWDEQVEGDRRRITVHFKQKVMGAIPINLALSQPIAQIPEKLDAPRVEVDGAFKQIGQMIIRSARGIRLGVATRQGVSEINPATLSIRETGVLAFKLLRPNWVLQLQTEVLEPLISTEFLHVARVSEGMVRHEHYLYYRLRHAGVKALNVRIPADALGLTISGPKIARSQQVKPGLWRVELTEKQFDRPYLLRVDYQSRFDRTQGEVPIVGVEPLDADQTRGHIALFTSDRIELKEQTVGPALQPAEARNISPQFGAGDLAEAAYCVTTFSTDYKLVMSARRHGAADLLEADVRSTHITSVVTESGQSIHRVQLQMMVGSKRHLRMRMPDGSSLWSLLVNGRAAIPSHVNGQGGEVWLIPLAQAAAGDLPVSVDLVYVSAQRFDRWLGRREFYGPRFDLPLKDIEWAFHLPEGYVYDDFEGTLTHVDEDRTVQVLQYGLQQYEQTIEQVQQTRNTRAMEFQRKAKQVAQQGGKFGQYQAREMLEQARSWSYNDRALNEDINVDLNNLLRQQAKVGIVGNRGRLRQQTPEQQPAQNNAPDAAGNLGDQFSVQQAERVESSLSAADNENLDLITRRLIQVQQTAAGSRIQLMVQMPKRGRVLRFTRPLQVESEMVVSFDAQQQITSRLPRGVSWAAGLFLVLAMGLWLSGVVGQGMDRAAATLARTHHHRRRNVVDDPYAVSDASDTEPISASELNLPADTPAKPQAPAVEDDDQAPPPDSDPDQTAGEDDEDVPRG